MTATFSRVTAPGEHPYLKQFFRIMRLTSLLLLLSLLQVSAKGLGQINLQAKETPLNQVLEQIRKQSGYVFLTNQAELGQYKVTALLQNADIKTAMEKVVSGFPLQYKIIDKTIVIKQKASSAPIIEAISPEDIEVSGRIMDEEGRILEGTSVWATKGGVIAGTSSDRTGYFILRKIPHDAILHISAVGYAPVEISLTKAKLPIEIRLRADVKKLDEVNVTYKTGYQQISKDRATGSFVQINRELLERLPSTNLLDRIAYVTSGMIFDRKVNLNAQGERQTPFIIRGLSTIDGNPHPLIVIDGFPYEETTVEGSNAYLILNNLNPNDVADVTILRDAAAASIWGSKAGNGVIVITTKKGRLNQAARIDFTTNLSIRDKEDLSYLPMMSSADAVEAHKLLYSRNVYNSYDATLPNARSFPVLPEAAEVLLQLRKGAITQAEADAKLAQLAAYDNRNDVEKYLMQRGINQQYALSVSGGSDRFTYYTSVGLDKNRATSIGNEGSRITLRTDNTYKVSKQLTLNAYINYTQGKNVNNGFDYMGLLTNAPLYTKIADEQGNALAIPYKFRTAFADTVRYPGLMDWHYYPLQERNNRNYSSNTMDIRTGASLQYTLPLGFKLDVNYQYQRILHETRNINGENSFYSRDFVNRFTGGTPTAITYPIQRGAIIFANNNIEKYWQTRIQLNYNRSFGDRHNVTALAGMDASQRTVEGVSDNWYGFNEETGVFQTFINYETQYPTRPAVSQERIPNGNNVFGTLRRQRSYFANAAYTYNNLYTLTVSGRQDGANIFGVKTNQQLSPFWSAGALWNISQEKFYQFKLIPSLKFRATYGFNGNYKNASAFPTITYNTSGTTGLQAAQFTSFANPYLRWEKTRVTNFGLDFGFIGNRISGSLEYYMKDGIDLVGTVDNDPTSGIGSYSGNISGIRGRGFDVSLSTRNFTGRLQWNTTINISYNTNKVTAFKGTYQAGQLLGGGQPVVGRNRWGMYSYKWAGLDDKGMPMGILADTAASYKTVLGFTGPTPNLKADDLLYHGTTTPLYSGNMMNTFSFKGWTASFNISYAFDYYFRRTSVNYDLLYPESSMGGTYSKSVTHKDYAKRWQKAGDEKFTIVPGMPAAKDFNMASFYSNSSILVEKGDHIRLRDIRLSYDFQGLPLNKLLKKTQLSVMMSNVGLLWKANKQGLDPDYAAREIPEARSYTVSLQVSL